MTQAERAEPGIINGSRRSRIAKGCGRSVEEVNRLLKQFEDMKKVMGMMAKGAACLASLACACQAGALMTASRHTPLDRHHDKILDGKATSLAIEAELTEAVQARLAQGMKRPHLAAVLVGDNPASRAYVGHKVKACARVGFESTLVENPADITQSALLEVVRRPERQSRHRRLHCPAPPPRPH